MGDLQRREFHEALLEAAGFKDLPGKWQAAILEAEQNRPKLRLVRGDWRPLGGRTGTPGAPKHGLRAWRCVWSGR